MPKRKKININDIQKSKYFLPLINDDNIINNIKSNSWFDIKESNYNLKLENIISTNLIDIKQHNFIKSQQIKLTTTNEQKYILLKWIEASRIIYNLTVYYFNKNKFISFQKVRPIIKSLFNKQLIKFINKYNLPVHIIDNSINDVCKAYKSNYELLKLKLITHFKLRYKKFTKDKQTIVLEKEDFSKKYNCFYSGRFTQKNINSIILIDKIKKENKILKNKYNKCKHINKLLNINNRINNLLINNSNNKNNNLITSKSILKKNITCNVRLTYNKLKDIFILNIPKEFIKNDMIRKEKICGIDPGNKTFLTVYNPLGKVIKLYNRDDTKINLKKLVVKRKQIDEYIKYKKTNKGYKKELINKNKEIYDKSINKIQKYYNKLTNKIQNIVKDLHYKCANYLCSNYTNIFLGKLSTKSIVSKEQKLNKDEKLFTYAISHDKFRTILTNKVKEYGIKLNIVCEGFTSKTCGNCGKVNEVGLKRILTCNCKVSIDRDVNGARNILIKHLPHLL